MSRATSIRFSRSRRCRPECGSGDGDTGQEPVLYRSDLSEAEWSELRRRLGEEERLFEEMFGLVLEARAEGIASIDPSGSLAENRFPSGGTVGHAALLLIAKLREDTARSADRARVVSAITELAEIHRHRWAGELVDAPERLATRVTELLLDLRLAEWVSAGAQAETAASSPSGAVSWGADPAAPLMLRLLPAAARFLPVTDTDAAEKQERLW